MSEALKHLVEVSRLFGSDSSYVIAGGGNTSYKNDEKIWIKASGISLATITEAGFVSLSREKLHIIASKVYSSDALFRENEVKEDLHAAIVAPKDLRPSVETSLHELIPFPYIVHTHPTLVNGIMCSQHAALVCDELFGAEALFIPYTDPGYILFKKVDEEIGKFKAKYGEVPALIFLENHGVFVGAETTDEICAHYENMMNKIKSRVQQPLPNADRRMLHAAFLQKPELLHPGYKGFAASGITSTLIKKYIATAVDFEKACKSFTPDDIVYCKAHYLYIPEGNSQDGFIAAAGSLIGQYFEKYGYMPKVLAFQNLGIAGIEENAKSVENVLDVYENILKISHYSDNFGGPKFLNNEQIAFIDNWEVENYRRKVAKS